METAEVDVLVVGAGPAGLAAAIELRSLGTRRVWVVDRENIAGGVPRHCEHTGFGWGDMRRILSGPSYAKRYVSNAEKSGVRIHTNVTVTDWLGPNQVNVTSSRGISAIKASAIVLATGCRERPRAARLVPGTRPFGVLTTGSLQRFVHEFNHPVGEKAIIIGAEHISYSAAHTLRKSGISVAGMVTSHPYHQSFGIYIKVANGLSSFPLYSNCRITNILGKNKVEAVEITEIPTGKIQAITCDTVIFTGDWVPEQELARKAGLSIDAKTHGPEIDGKLRSSMHGVFAVGNLVHPGETADTAAISGRSVARHVDNFLRNDNWRVEKRISFEFDERIIQWVSPNILESGQTTLPHGHFLLRVSKFMANKTLMISQDENLLWSRKFRRLVPNLPYHFPALFLTSLDPKGGDVRLTLMSN
jgi:NADPH-dependent 2,4-dienoyl-CoA reductase/sulfur reductase-like enzyme